jgi:hypothetical protein
LVCERGANEFAAVAVLRFSLTTHEYNSEIFLVSGVEAFDATLEEFFCAAFGVVHTAIRVACFITWATAKCIAHKDITDFLMG